jgi:uncharacterized membrane protein YkoI
MNINFPVTPALFIAFMLLSPLHAAQADDDHIEARYLLDAGEILPLESILKNVREKFPGKILEVKLEREHQEIAYEVEVLGDDSVVREVYIDARTGKVLSSKEDD